MSPSAYVADLAQRIAAKLTNYVYQPLHESRAAEIIRAEIQAYRTEMEAEHCVDPATWTVTRPEPKEPEVVALDDPTVPYSLVPLGGSASPEPKRNWHAIEGPNGLCACGVKADGTVVTCGGLLEKYIADRVRAAAAPQPQPETHEQFGHRLLARAYDRLNLCPDHRDKTGDYCIVCKAEQRTREELRGAVPASPWQPISSARERADDMAADFFRKWPGVTGISQNDLGAWFHAAMGVGGSMVREELATQDGEK